MTEIKPILPAESSSTEMTRFNALRHGVLSRYTVLPWEDADEYRALRRGARSRARAARDQPKSISSRNWPASCGASAGYAWPRLPPIGADWKPRSRPGAIRWKQLWSTSMPLARCEGVVDAIRATQAETEKDIADIEENEAMTRHALDLLGSGRNEAYEAALAALRDDTRQWWEDQVTGDTEVLDEDKEGYPGDTAGLRDFLEGEILPRLARRGKELSNRPLIREQAFGEAFDAAKLEQLGRYEVHLDRKLERMLTMLLRLKELRRAEPRPSNPFRKIGARHSRRARRWRSVIANRT